MGPSNLFTCIMFASFNLACSSKTRTALRLARLRRQHSRHIDLNRPNDRHGILNIYDTAASQQRSFVRSNQQELAASSANVQSGAGRDQSKGIFPKNGVAHRRVQEGLSETQGEVGNNSSEKSQSQSMMNMTSQMSNSNTSTSPSNTQSELNGNDAKYNSSNNDVTSGTAMHNETGLGATESADQDIVVDAESEQLPISSTSSVAAEFAEEGEEQYQQPPSFAPSEHTSSTVPSTPETNSTDNSSSSSSSSGTEPSMSESEKDELLLDEERKVRRMGGFGAFLALAAMIFTAWQMSENPDGIYAAMCRLIITIIGLVVRIFLSPCRGCLGGGTPYYGGSGFGYNGRHSYGHIPVATSSSALDYGYKDPSLELS